MVQIVPLLQLILAVLSLPVATGLLGWLCSRFSKEHRLLLLVERLSLILPSLPEGSAKSEYAERVSDALRALNVRLDPLFKIERRRKRIVVVWLVVVLGLTAAFANVAHVASGNLQTIVSIIFGGLGVLAFTLIERDTKKQRKALSQ